MKLRGIKRIAVLFGLLVFNVSQAGLDAEQLKNSFVTVIAKKGNTEIESTGIVVENESVLTVRPAGKNIGDFSVRPWAGESTIVASFRELVDEGPLVLLDVPGLESTAVSFTTVEPVSGRTAYSPELLSENYEIRRGALGGSLEYQPTKGVFFIKPKGPLLSLVSHNALVAAKSFGAPVLNDCGEVMGVSIADPRLDRSELMNDPQDIMVAVKSAQVTQWLQAASIGITTTTETCLSSEQQAAAKVLEAEAEAAAKVLEAEAEAAAKVLEAEAETAAKVLEAEAETATAAEKKREAEAKRAKAESEVEEAEAALEEALSQATASEEEKAAAQQALDAARNSLESANNEMQMLQAEIEEIRLEALARDSEWIEKARLYGGTAAGVLFLVLLLWWLTARRKKHLVAAADQRAEQAAQKAQDVILEAQARLAPFDCVLEGHDTDGKRYLLKLHKLVLGEPQGVILGRNPGNSTFVIGHEGISREHARFFVEDDSLFVEDLGSGNGTRVNGVGLIPKNAVRVNHGATIEFGPVLFQVDLVR